MILYIVYDKKNNSCTPPIVANNISEAQHALDTLNPENVTDLIIHELFQFVSLYDLFLLTINEDKKLPDFLFNRSDVACEANASTRPSGEDAPHETL